MAHLTPELKSGEVVLVMSNGGFGGNYEKLLDALGRKSGGVSGARDGSGEARANGMKPVRG